MKGNLNELALFLTVVKEKSFTGAAARSNLSQPAVSQTISSLESRLRLKLLNRTTRSLTLTEAGERLVELIAPAVREIEDGLNRLAELRDMPAGRIRISADEYAIQQVLWPRLSPVLKNYPDIQLELVSDYNLVDIARERFDAGVRRGGLIAKNRIAVPISAEHLMAVVASPEVLTKWPLPQSPSDLLALPCINLQISSQGQRFGWIFSIAGQEHRLQVSGQITVNSINRSHKACLDGYGFAYLPRALVENDIACGRLIGVLDSYAVTFPRYYLYYTSRLKPSAAFDVIVNALRYPTPLPA